MAVLESVPPDTKQRIEQLGTVDIVLGLPTYNNAGTIPEVVRGLQAGLQMHLSSSKSVIVHSDGGSKDGTSESVMAAAATDTIPILQVPYPVYPVQKLTSPSLGMPGKSSAYRTIFEVATQLGARACAMVDSEIPAINPAVPGRLIRPVLEGQFDFVASRHLRDKFDGSITNSIVYPIIRALYGKRVRQPFGGDFCLSAKLIQRCLAQRTWDTDIARSAIDIWLVTQAISSGSRVCEAFLGVKPRTNPRDSTVDLSALLSQILGTVFLEMERNLVIWQKIRGSEPVALFNDELPGGMSPKAEPAVLDVKRMIEAFRIGQQNLQGVWSLVLPPATLVELKKLATRTETDFRLEDALWARIIYDFSLAHRQRIMNRDHLLQALAPLYWAWLASFGIEEHTADHFGAETRIEQLCMRYEGEKPYLISRWRWPDRFNP